MNVRLRIKARALCNRDKADWNATHWNATNNENVAVKIEIYSELTKPDGCGVCF
jgi:hypothetical protein